MSKRILSLVLALAMLVLAVPVFALPTLAAETPNPTVNFVVGQDAYDRTTAAIEGSSNVTATYQNYGTVVKTGKWDTLTLPTDAELAGFGLKAADILTWAYWDNVGNIFCDIRDYTDGFAVMTETETIDLYPVYRNATLWGQGNMPSFTVVRTDVSAASNGYVANASRPAGAPAESATLNGFRGGFTLEDWARATNTLTGYHKTLGARYFTLYRNSLWDTGGYYARSGEFVVAGNAKASSTTVGYQVMANAAMTVTVPKNTGIRYIVLLNDEVLLGGTAAGNAATAAVVQNTENWGSFAASDGNASVSFAAEKGDTIRVVFCHTSATTTNVGVYAGPTVSYDELHEEGMVYASSFLNNRPTSIGYDIGDGAVGSSEPIAYKGNWDYVTYASSALTDPIPLTTRYTQSSYKEEWYLSDGVTNVSAAKGFVNANGAAESGDWPGYAMGLYRGTVVGTRYTAPRTGMINLSIDRILNLSLATPGAPTGLTGGILTLGYAIYVGGERVFPAGEAWHEITYYSANVPASLKTAKNQGVLGAGADNVGNLNSQLPTALAVDAGDTVEFLVCGISLAGVTGEEITTETAYWNQYNAHYNYFDGTVTYTSGRSAFLENRPTSIGYNIGDGSAGQNEPIAYRGYWDYITYATLDRTGAAPLTTRITQGTYKEEWYVSTGVTAIANANANGFVNANEKTETGSWPAYGMGVRASKITGTRYTAPRTGVINISVDRILNTVVSDNSTLTLGYAIYVGGEKIWPSDTEWCKVTYYGTGATERTDFTEGVIGANMVDMLEISLPRDIPVEKGETVEFLVAGLSHYNPVSVPENPAYWNHYTTKGNYFDATVSYSSVYKPSAVLAAPSIGDTIDIAFALATPSADGGILVDGVERNTLTVAPQDADRAFTVQSYLTMAGEKKLYGEVKTVTLNGLLEKYLDTTGYGERAAAALAYTRAFAAYFAGDAVPAPEAPLGNYFHKAADSYLKVASYTGSDRVGFRGVSLLLNEKVNIKVVVNALDARYALEVATDPAFSDAVSITNRDITEDKAGTKFIMDGISVLEWDTDYYFRIVDTANGRKTVSDTLRYGVSVYYARMNADPLAGANIKNLAKTMMNLYESLNGSAYPEGLGDRIPLGSPVLLRNPYGELADAGSVSISASADYAGAILRADAGFSITGSSLVLENVTLVGPVSFAGAQNVTLRNVQILADGKTAVTVDAASADILFEDCRIEGDVAVMTAGNNTAFLRSYIGYEMTGISSVADDGLYLADCRIVGGSGTAIASDADNTEIRQCSVSAEATAVAIQIGECRNALVGASVIRGTQNSLRLTGTDNASVTRNSAAGITASNGKHVYVIDNELVGTLSLYDNNYLIANGNSFPNGDPRGANVDMIGNQNKNGDNLMDVNARLSVGADPNLVPHVDKDQFLTEPRLDTVKDPAVDAAQTIGEYIRQNATVSDFVILMPGSYASTGITLSTPHKNTVVYGYGVELEYPLGDTVDYRSNNPHLIVTDTENVSVKGATLSYERDSAGQAYIVEMCGNNRIRLYTAAGFYEDFMGSNLILFKDNGVNFFPGGQMYPGLHEITNATMTFISRESDGTLIFEVRAADYARLSVGDVMTCRNRVGASAHVGTRYSSGILYEDLTVYGNSGAACFAESYTTGAVTYHRVVDTNPAAEIIDKATYDRYKALEIQYGLTTDVRMDDNGNYRGDISRYSSIDATHVVGSRVGSQIISSLFENMCDDATNQHSYPSRLSTVYDNGDGKTATVVYKPLLASTDYSASNPTPRSMTHDFGIGDRVYIYNNEGEVVIDARALSATAESGTVTYTDPSYGEITIKTYTVTVPIGAVNWDALDGYTLDTKDAAASTWENNGYDPANRITLDNRSYYADGFKIDNLIARNVRSRALVIKSADGIVKNCTFENFASEGYLSTLEKVWSESGVVENVLIENNIFDNVGYGNGGRAAIRIASPGYPDFTKDSCFSNFTIRGNVMKNRSSKYAIIVSGASDVRIEDNDFGSIGAEGKPTMTVQLDAVRDAIISGNTYPDSSVAVAETFSFTNVSGVIGSDVGIPESTPAEPLTTSKIGGAPVSEFYVVYEKEGLASVAASLAAELSAITGMKIPYGVYTARPTRIVLTADTDADAGTVGNTAHMTLDGTALTLSADNRNTLSLAVSALLADLRANEDIVSGTDCDIPLATAFYAANDTELFKYCGYWAETGSANPTGMTAYWNTSYVEIAFSGNVITVEFDKATTFEARIDKGGYTKYSGVTEKTFFAEGAGTHVLRIYQNANSSVIPHIPFAGVTAGEDVVISRAPNKAHYMQFLGASGTDTPTGYAQQLADMLDYDFCVVARAGISLQTEKSLWAVDSIIHYALLGNQNLGMEGAFFKLGLPNAFADISTADADMKMLSQALRAGYDTNDLPGVPSYYLGTAYESGDTYKAYYNSLSAEDQAKLDEMVDTIRAGGEPAELTALKEEYADFIEGWNTGAYDMDFSSMTYKPDIVYLLIGTNDAIRGGATNPSYTGFVDTYLEFIAAIKSEEVYGADTDIIVMNCLKLPNGETDESRYAALDEVYEKLLAKYGEGIYAITSTQTKYIAYETGMEFPDGLHTNDAGQTILANELLPIVQGFYE